MVDLYYRALNGGGIHHNAHHIILACSQQQMDPLNLFVGCNDPCSQLSAAGCIIKLVFNHSILINKLSLNQCPLTSPWSQKTPNPVIECSYLSDEVGESLACTYPLEPTESALQYKVECFLPSSTQVCSCK